MSTLAARRRKVAAPAGDLRSSVMLRLLRCRFWKSGPWRAPPRPSPASKRSGSSTLMTLAPQSASWRTAVGPARTRVKSRTVKRWSALEALAMGMGLPQAQACCASRGAIAKDCRLAKAALSRGLRHATRCPWRRSSRMHRPHPQLLARIEGWVRRTRRVETMHVERPLQGDEGALDAGQQKEAAKKRQRQPDRQLNPDGRRQPALERQRTAHG